MHKCALELMGELMAPWGSAAGNGQKQWVISRVSSGIKLAFFSSFPQSKQQYSLSHLVSENWASSCDQINPVINSESTERIASNTGSNCHKVREKCLKWNQRGDTGDHPRSDLMLYYAKAMTALGKINCSYTSSFGNLHILGRKSPHCLCMILKILTMKEWPLAPFSGMLGWLERNLNQYLSR